MLNIPSIEGIPTMDILEPAARIAAIVSAACATLMVLRVYGVI